MPYHIITVEKIFWLNNMRANNCVESKDISIDYKSKTKTICKK